MSYHMFVQNCLSLALVMCLKCTVLVQKTGTGRKTYSTGELFGLLIKLCELF